MKGRKKHISIGGSNKHRNLQRIAYYNTGSLEDAQNFNLVGNETEYHLTESSQKSKVKGQRSKVKG